VWAFVFDVNRREGWTVATMAGVRVRRVYDEPEDNDGVRVLVDRIWPRGMTKARAALDEWCKDVAPSTELRKWYSHDPAKFEEFRHRYGAELKQAERAQALQHLRNLAADRRLTLLTGSKAVDISEAAVLAAILNRYPKAPERAPRPRGVITCWSGGGGEELARLVESVWRLTAVGRGWDKLLVDPWTHRPADRSGGAAGACRRRESRWLLRR